MAVKVLGQVSPLATTDTVLYTAVGPTVVSTLAVCNRSGVSVSYRIAVRPAGAALADQHYIGYGLLLPVNSSDFLTIGITLAATDVISVYASTADLSFSLFGDAS